MSESNPARVIHVTGTQRSGHSFIGNVLTTNEGLAWWKQHDEEPWMLKGALESMWQCIHPSLNFLKVRNDEYQDITNDGWATHDHPSSSVTLGGKNLHGIRAIRVTEYQHPDWYELHVSSHVSSSARTINVVRDPRNVLASAIGKGWDQTHCEELLAGCEYQYVNEEIKSCINISYEETVRYLRGDSKDKFVGGVKLNEWALPAINNLQRRHGNTSFEDTTNAQEYFERYKRPDIVTNPIFQSLISKAEEIYNTHHVPFLNSIK